MRETPNDASRSVPPGQYLSFFLGGEEYGLGILCVREIVECGPITRVPGTPPFIRGVINLRGSVVPVVDLAVKFGLAPTVVTKWSCVVIVEPTWEGEGMVMGVIADAVSRVLDLTAAEIEPPPPFGAPVRFEYLLGMGRTEAKFVLLLDVDRVLSLEELAAVADLERGSTPADDSAPADIDAAGGRRETGPTT